MRVWELSEGILIFEFIEETLFRSSFIGWNSYTKGRASRIDTLIKNEF
jgi:hypothetical protein